METSPTESEFKKPLRVLIRAYAQAVSEHARLETTHAPISLAEAAGHVKNTLMNVERRLDEIADKLGETP